MRDALHFAAVALILATRASWQAVKAWRIGGRDAGRTAFDHALRGLD